MSEGIGNILWLIFAKNKRSSGKLQGSVRYLIVLGRLEALLYAYFYSMFI